MRQQNDDVVLEAVSGDATAFARFVFPRRRAMLIDVASPWIAVGAWWRSLPAGMALVWAGGTVPLLESVMVEAPLRRRGIGTMLVEAAGAAIAHGGGTAIEARYPGDLPHRVALEATLAGAGFAPPVLAAIQLVGLAGAMAEGGGAWRPVHRAACELGDYTVEPLSLDRPGDDAAVTAILAADPTLGVEHPGGTPFDPSVSRALRLRGTIVGWVAGRRLDHSMGRDTLTTEAPTFIYTGARIADGHYRGLMLLLYHRAFSAQAASHGPASRIVYQTHPGAAAMFAFTRQRFAPMALRLSETWRATADLAGAAAPGPGAAAASERSAR